MAEHLGVPERTIFNWETGHKRPGFFILKRYCAALKIEPQSFLIAGDEAWSFALASLSPLSTPAGERLPQTARKAQMAKNLPPDVAVIPTPKAPVQVRAQDARDKFHANFMRGLEMTKKEGTGGA